MHFFSRSRTGLHLGSPRYAPVGRSNTSSDDDSVEGSLLEKAHDSPEPPAPSWNRLRYMALLQIVLLAVYTLPLLYMGNRLRSLSAHGPQLIDSPAKDAVVWEEHKFYLGDKIQEKSKYSGKPSPSVDKAWHDLLNAENIRLEPELVKKLGREDITVRIPGDDGYIGTLNVYHELHCLKRLHQYMYQDHYWTDLDDNQREMNRLHSEHCIDFLRQSVMCHGDIGLITYEWNARTRIPVANATTHQCVNWNKLDEWTKERTVDMMAPGFLVHPILGLAYPDGQGTRTGALAKADHDH